MEIIKKISIITLIITTIIGGIFFPSISNATAKTAILYGTHTYNNLLEREGMNINCIYTVHNQNGVEYPVYCLNLELDGATEEYSYTVNIDNQITNMEIWRTVINGYPYKTLEELGCETKEEAYLATKQAVYCALYDRDPDSYGAIGGEAGERTLNALKQIVNAARTSTETKLSTTLTITETKTKWEVDNLEENYVSKEFTVTASAGIKDYTINLTGNLIEGMKLTDINNVEKSEFESDEKFKILIPIKNIGNDGNFTINANGEVATKPVLYGSSEDSILQDVALAGSIYEAGAGSKTEYYFENETKIVVLKQNQETKEVLKGVKFQLLNENKEIIYSDLITDEEGLITIENLLPGKYYIEELETLEGFDVYEQLIEIDLKLNEEIKITVNNLQDDTTPEIEKINTELEIEQIKTEKEVEQIKIEEEITQEQTTSYTKITLPKTGM